MSLRLPIQDNKFATVLNVCAPTLQPETGIKEAFYRELHNLLEHFDSKDKLLILGDFTERVGRDFKLWKRVLGRHGIGSCNDNGRLLQGWKTHACTKQSSKESSKKESVIAELLESVTNTS